MRADKDIIARDRAGVERFVRFGSDIPGGWKYVRDAEGSVLPPDAEAPRTVGNVDAAQARADRLRGDLGRQRTRTAGAGESVATPEPTPQVEPIRPITEQVAYDDTPKEELEAEVERRRAAGREITVEGSGSGGNVVKDDIVTALEADDAATRADAGS